MHNTFVKLLSEVPDDTIVSKSMSGFVSAKDMIQHIKDNTETGKQYMSEALRVCRDLIIRQCKRES